MVRFRVGDTVVICEGVDQCIYGVNSEMRELIGEEAEIIHIGYSAYRDSVFYNISIGVSGYKWDDNCFMTVAEWNTEQKNMIVTDDEFSEIMSFLSNPGK